ncbi:MAG: response regulator [Proteobacteria bacterium]|nr:response regulator [Pseudomonadota bacterium]
MPPSSPLLPALRWVTLATIAGTIVAMVVDLLSMHGPWLIVALALGVVSFVCCFTALRLLDRAIENAAAGIRKASDAAQQASHDASEQNAQFDSMRNQLEEYRRLQEELTAAKQAAEQGALAKSEFLATMSHEVRTPLNGIVPILELLQSSRLELDQRELLNTALQSARQLLRIVDDILDYSKLEAHKLQLESVTLNLRETLDSVIRLLERQAQSKGLRLSLHIGPDVRAVFRGDPVRLRQIVSNLVSNALKFTERGSITVQVAKLKETRTHHQLRFEVQDTGVGISPEAAGKLFSAFSQADASTTRVYGGTGLGLAICKRIVDLMGGRIGVDSEVGRGSTFWFEIPMLKVSGDIEGPRSGLQGARLLVLTNDATLHKRIAASLAQTGASVQFVENTQDALAQLRAVAAAPGRSFDVLIVDAASIKHTLVALQRNLATMSDAERMRVLILEPPEPLPEDVRELPNTVIVQRALAESDLRPKLVELMAGEAISTSGRDSSPAVTLTAGDASTTAPPPRAPAPAPAPSAERAALVGPLRGRLLLVEDNPVNLMVAQRLIALLGLQCDTAENGEQAIEKIKRGRYDVVLMDCQMPVLDGYSATRAWRVHEAQHHLRPLPIIAMTANAMAGDRQKCLDAGMDDYLSKPVARDQLESTLRRWLASRAHAVGDLPLPEEPAPVVGAAPLPASPPAKAVLSVLTADEIAAAGQLLEQATAQFVAEMGAEAEHASDALAAPPTRAAGATPTTPTAPATAATPAAASTPPPPAPAPAPEAAPAAPRKLPPALEAEIVEDLWSAMGDSFRDLVNVYLEDAPVHLGKLDAAVASNDVGALVGPAHALKSSSANLGAMQVSAAAKHVEHGARNGTLTQPQVAVKVLHYEFKRAEAELRSLLGD